MMSPRLARGGELVTDDEHIAKEDHRENPAQLSGVTLRARQRRKQNECRQEENLERPSAQQARDDDHEIRQT